MGQRLQLQSLLEALLGSNQVYFQPPSNVQMSYPAIVYARDTEDTKFADNVPYRRTKRYTVTVIETDIDSPIPDKVAELPRCSFSRHFVVDTLYHDVYNLYF